MLLISKVVLVVNENTSCLFQVTLTNISVSSIPVCADGSCKCLDLDLYFGEFFTLKVTVLIN